MLGFSVIFTILFIMNSNQATESLTLCSNTSVHCLSNTTYITCVNAGAFTIRLNTELICPEGYICSESVLSHPCIKEGDAEKDKTTESITTTESTTTTELTTKATQASTARRATTKAPRPSDPPECTETTIGFSPAAECNKYYECYAKRNFLFGYSYVVALRTCDDGKSFDTRSLTCVLEADSDC